MTLASARTFTENYLAWAWMNSWSRQSPAAWPHPLAGQCVMRFSRAGDYWHEELLRDCLLTKPTMEYEGETVKFSHDLAGGFMEFYRAGKLCLISAEGTGGTADVVLTDDTGKALFADMIL